MCIYRWKLLLFVSFPLDSYATYIVIRWSYYRLYVCVCVCLSVRVLSKLRVCIRNATMISPATYARVPTYSYMRVYKGPIRV